MTTEIGALAGALAKAQVQFRTVKRDKEVVVKTKTGGEYRFKYAPLDSILEAVRKPLADQGLVVVQILDDGDLVTSLVHESGAIMSGRVSLPPTTDVQAYGSAITYLRRYAIQALLGIAAEDDDDGNRAAGNEHTFGARPELDRPVSDLIGTVEVGKPPVDMQLREDRELGPVYGFKLKSGTKAFQVLATGDLAAALSTVGLETGTRVTVEGSMVMVPWDKGGVAMPPFSRVMVTRVHSSDWTLPMVEAPTVPMFDDDEAAAILALELAEAKA